MPELIYDLLKNRILKTADEIGDCGIYCGYFKEVGGFITDVINLYEELVTGRYYTLAARDKKPLLDNLYRHVAENYDDSFLNPDKAVSVFGTDMGRVLSAVYAELFSAIGYAFDKDREALVIRLSLYLEIYGAVCMSLTEENEAGEDTAARLGAILKDYAFDYSMQMALNSAGNLYGRDNKAAGRIIAEADLSNTDYLYDYGEYIGDNEIKVSGYLASLSEEKIELMASVYVNGYIKGFEVTGKDVTLKNLVEIRYFIGFERVVRKAVKLFKEAGLDVSLRRSEVSFVAGRKLNKTGYYSTVVNRQFEADHENDRALYYDRRLMEHRLMCYRNALEEYKTEAGGYGGPAVIESFGEKSEVLSIKESAVRPDEAFCRLSSEYTVKAVDILNEYVKGEERSFTIIAFPIPAIGDDFEAVFNETLKLNTLGYEKYRDIQQKMIDVLDKADHVRILGDNGNETDLKVKLWKLKDPDKETSFENCVADVNIPVGEVFTSPVLKGTEGLLHVKKVYLNEMPFIDLKLRIKDGMIADYSLGNYPDKKDNDEYMKKYLLFSHDSLPMGEFAIGTNTTAYAMIKRYALWSVMPILIAEKTGPHFAMGDTCYSHEEDMVTYNPDGKAIVARENSISAARKSDPLKAYYGCHTDITIPYDELKRLYAVTESGEISDIIKDGRFVLEGTEELNVPLDEL